VFNFFSHSRACDAPPGESLCSLYFLAKLLRLPPFSPKSAQSFHIPEGDDMTLERLNRSLARSLTACCLAVMMTGSSSTWVRAMAAP
jgi:hypothetical protein